MATRAGSGERDHHLVGLAANRYGRPTCRAERPPRRRQRRHRLAGSVHHRRGPARLECAEPPNPNRLAVFSHGIIPVRFGPAAPAAGLNRLGELKVLVVGLDGNLWTATLYIGVPGPNSQSMFISLGQPSAPTIPAIVPDVRELRVPAAKAAVEQAHLVAKFTGASSGNPWVSTQSPAAGTTVERGSTVTMQLRTGPIL